MSDARSTRQSPPLVVAAHGTADPAGQAAVVACAERAAGLLGLDQVRVGYVDVCGPTLEEVLTDPNGSDPVVVPYFLASGYHVRHDVPSAVEGVPGATVTPALGVDELVLDALESRVTEALPGPDAVLLVGAGSSVDAARAEVAEAADQLGRRLGVATGTAFLSGPGPRPEEELERLRAQRHTRIALAAHLLSPGYFLDKAHAIAAAADTSAEGEAGGGAAEDAGGQAASGERQEGEAVRVVATGPLGTHPALAALVARRYREATTP